MVVLTPASPLASVGPRIEPDVSVPIVAAAKAIDAATPEPELDPEGSPIVVGVLVYAFLTRPPSDDQPFGLPSEVQLANSPRFALPRIIAPASRSLLAIVASRVGCAPSRVIESAVVGMSLVATLSLSRTGMPS